MNYELAKKLRGSGFKQYGQSLRAWGKDDEGGYSVFAGYTNNQKGRAYIPTLSELIEACGLAFSELVKITHDKEPQKWIATTYSCEQCGIDNMVSVSGSTPEEALAKLWLELNKHER